MSWISKKMNEAKLQRAHENAYEEALYARVAAEVHLSDIRPGLWAKALSTSEGDELKAKARYVLLRVEQLQIQMSAAGALEQSSNNPVTSAHSSQIDQMSESADLTEFTRMLISGGCRVRKLGAGEWEILHPSGITEFARSPQTLKGIAYRYVGDGTSAA